MPKMEKTRQKVLKDNNFSVTLSDRLTFNSKFYDR